MKHGFTARLCVAVVAMVCVGLAGSPIAVGQTAQPVALCGALAGTASGQPLPFTATPGGSLCVAGTTIIAGATFTTPAGVTAYSSGQLIANSATAGSVTPLSFTVCRSNAGTGMVRRVRIKTPDTGFAGVTVTLKLHRDSPTYTNGDHATWLTTESNYLGALSVTLDQHFSDAEKGIGAPTVGTEINFDCAAGVQTIYGEVVSGGAITPQGAKLMSVVLEVLAN